MSEEPLLYDVADHVATITLNRPERRNAISGGMLTALGKRLQEADRSGDVRAIIITGAEGGGFCAGLDLVDATSGRGIGTGTNDDGSAPAGGNSMQTRDLPTVVLFEIDTPVIAAINGGAAGYGLDLALGCDIRLMAESAKLAAAFTKRGVVPESGGTWYLPRLVGWGKAAELIYLGKTVLAEEALEIGLVNAVVPDGDLMKTAQDWAQQIAANAPLAVQSSKRLMRHGWTEDFQSHTHHVLLETIRLFGTKDFREGITSFMEKRPPEFTGR
ncbi:MAG TPA: enoyl-CoA hydratase-related protein [Acidimicrobiales bacterium]|nr:enoyl-CoA hydratase-related protein [Acidimicrobiales bacterium]